MIKMKTYVKINEKSTGKALERLRKIAIAMPKVCVFDTALQEELAIGSLKGPVTLQSSGEGEIEGSIKMVMSYFGGPDNITKERCASIISEDKDLGGYDFAYEWTSKPTTDQVKKLEKDIKTTLDPLNIKYNIDSK